MKLQENGSGVAGAFRDVARARSLGDTEQEADHEISQEQAAELVGKFGRPTIEQTGRSRPTTGSVSTSSRPLSRRCMRRPTQPMRPIGPKSQNSLPGGPAAPSADYVPRETSNSTWPLGSIMCGHF